MADEAVSVPRLMLKSEYARHRKVSPPMVSHWVKHGRIAIVDGKVDVEASDAMLAQSLDPARGGVGGHDVIRDGRQGRPPAVLAPITDIVAANVDDKRASAELKRMRLRREAGELVDAAEFVAATEQAFGVVKEGLSGMGARLGAMLAAKLGADPRVVIATVDGEARKIGDALRDKLSALAA